MNTPRPPRLPVELCERLNAFAATLRSKNQRKHLRRLVRDDNDGDALECLGALLKYGGMTKAQQYECRDLAVIVEAIHRVGGRCS